MGTAPKLFHGDVPVPVALGSDGTAGFHRRRDLAKSGAGSVIVLGNYRAAITAVRELSDRGCTVVLGAEPETYCAEHSRFVDEVWHCPPFVPHSEVFLTALRALAGRLPQPVTVMPILERSLDTIASLEQVLAPEMRLALPQARIISVLHDKYRSLVAARDAGLDVPGFAVAEDFAQLREQTLKIGCPVVIRPLVAGSRLGSRKALTIREPAELDAAFPAADKLPALIVQRHFSGPRLDVYFAARDGAILAEQPILCLRTDRADGTGLATEAVTIAPIASISRELRLLVRHFDYTGIGQAQFLYDAARDSSCFLEINPRFGAPYVHVEHVGMGLTGLAADLAWNDPRPVPERSDRFDAGTRLAWTLGDIAGVIHGLRHRQINRPQAVGWTGRALLAALRADVHATWTWRDPLPTLMLYLRRIGSTFGLMTRDVN